MLRKGHGDLYKATTKEERRKRAAKRMMIVIIDLLRFHPPWQNLGNTQKCVSLAKCSLIPNMHTLRKALSYSDFLTIRWTLNVNAFLVYLNYLIC